MSAKIKSFVALYDLHFGFERITTKGKRVLRTLHNLPAIKAATAFIKDFKPDVLILGGDQLNCGPISHWNRGKPRLTEDFRLKAEMDLLDNLILKPFAGIAEKVWLDGNHEHWIDQFLDENPGIEGLVEPAEYLRLKERGWQLRSQGEIYKLGKLNFIHGDTVRGRRNVAAKLVSEYRRNIRAGHHHTFEVATDVTPYDRSDFHTGISIPAMSSATPAYTKNAPSNFQQGFLFGWVQPNGCFSDYVVVINKGQFVWNGKVYGK